MKNRVFLALVFLVVSLFIADFWLWYGHDSDIDVEYIKTDNSGINNFYIKEDRYYINTAVYMQNNTDEEKKFIIAAESIEDYQLNSIKHPVLIAYDKKLASCEFTLAPNEGKVFQVVFVGEHDTNNQKFDRLDPDVIYAVVIE